MHVLTAALCGALFGIGLYISGMTDTQKVQGFLDERLKIRTVR